MSSLFPALLASARVVAQQHWVVKSMGSLLLYNLQSQEKYCDGRPFWKYLDSRLLFKPKWRKEKGNGSKKWIDMMLIRQKKIIYGVRVWWLYKITFRCIEFYVMKNEEKMVQKNIKCCSNWVITNYFLKKSSFYIWLFIFSPCPWFYKGEQNNFTNLEVTKKSVFSRTVSICNCCMFLVSFFLLIFAIFVALVFTHHFPICASSPVTKDQDICLCIKRLNNDRIIWLQAKCKLLTNLVTEWQRTE